MSNIEIDLNAILADIQKMTPEQMAEEVLKYKTAQKVATAKYSNPENAKKYRMNKAEKLKAMQAKLAEMGLLEGINAKATEQAKARLAAEKEEEQESASAVLADAE